MAPPASSKWSDSKSRDRDRSERDGTPVPSRRFFPGHLSFFFRWRLGGRTPRIKPPRCSGHRPTFVRTSRPRSCRERGRLARSSTAPQGSNRLRSSGRHGAITASKGTDPGQAPWNAECGVRNGQTPGKLQRPSSELQRSSKQGDPAQPGVDRVVRTGGNRGRIVGRGWSRWGWERGSVTRSNMATRKAMDCPPIDALINLGGRNELGRAGVAKTRSSCGRAVRAPVGSAGGSPARPPRPKARIDCKAAPTRSHNGLERDRSWLGTLEVALTGTVMGTGTPGGAGARTTVWHVWK